MLKLEIAFRKNYVLRAILEKLVEFLLESAPIIEKMTGVVIEGAIVYEYNGEENVEA